MCPSVQWGLSNGVRSLPQGCLWCSWLPAAPGNTLSPRWCWLSRLPPPPPSGSSTGHNPCNTDTQMVRKHFSCQSLVSKPEWKVRDSQGDKVFLHEEGWDPTELPQDVMMGPIQHDVHQGHPVVFPQRGEARGAVSEPTHAPRPVGQRRDHSWVALSHLVWLWW